MTQNILFVDDEKNILKAIERCLFDGDFNLFTARSGREGIRIMTKREMQVVITDMRMPGMDGAAFLTEAQKISPDAIYMVLSGYADIAYVMEAINTHHVWRYITKPWQDEDLQITVKNALELNRYQTVEKRLMVELAEKNRELAALNSVLEEKVARRTYALRVRNEILHLMIEDVDYEKIIARICGEIAKECNTAGLFVDVPFMDEVFSNQGRCRLPGDMARLSKTSQKTHARVEHTHGCAIPLLRDDVILGICLSDNPGLLKDEVKGWLSLLTLCLLQARSMKESPELVDKIDRLLHELK